MSTDISACTSAPSYQVCVRVAHGPIAFGSDQGPYPSHLLSNWLLTISPSENVATVQLGAASHDKMNIGVLETATSSAALLGERPLTMSDVNGKRTMCIPIQEGFQVKAEWPSTSHSGGIAIDERSESPGKIEEHSAPPESTFDIQSTPEGIKWATMQALTHLKRSVAAKQTRATPRFSQIDIAKLDAAKSAGEQVNLYLLSEADKAARAMTRTQSCLYSDVARMTGDKAESKEARGDVFRAARLWRIAGSMGLTDFRSKFNDVESVAQLGQEFERAVVQAREETANLGPQERYSQRAERLGHILTEYTDRLQESSDRGQVWSEAKQSEACAAYTNLIRNSGVLDRWGGVQDGWFADNLYLRALGSRNQGLTHLSESLALSNISVEPYDILGQPPKSNFLTNITLGPADSIFSDRIRGGSKRSIEQGHSVM